MDREGFRSRMKQYKKAREENPGLKYWEWRAQPAEKDVPKYDEGGEVGNKKAVPTVEEYITEQIDLKRADALNKSLTRTMPRVPYVGGNEITIGREQFNTDRSQKLANLNNLISQLERLFGGLNGGMYRMMNQRQYDQLLQQRAEVQAATYEQLSNGAIGPSCIYTATDNYGDPYLEMSNKSFMQNSGRNGFKNVPIKQARPGDIVIRADDEGGYHGMIFDSYDSQGRRLYNHSNGGHTAEAIRKKAKYPAREDQLSVYTFVGTPADSTSWKNEYKLLYGYAEGGEVGEDDLQYNIQETKDWLRNWYAARLQYGKQNNPNIIELISAIHNVFYPENNTHTLYLPWGDKEQINDLREPSIDTVPITINDQKIKEYNRKHNVTIGGYQHPAEGIVLPSNYDPLTLVHELAHTYNSYGNTFDATSKAITDEQGYVTIPSNLFNEEYWISPNEVHSRLMLFRKENNINPLKKHTIDDVKEMRKNTKDMFLFEIFDDNTMLKLLNDVAENTIEEKRTHKSKRA